MRELIFNLANGIYSGIPVCCNLFFTYRAYRGKHPVAAVVHEERTNQVFDCLGSNDADDGGGANYVQCNRCYAKKNTKKIRYNGTILRWLVGID